MGDRDWDTLAGRLGADAVKDGDPVRWFDELWTAGERDEVDLPWDRTDAYPAVEARVAALGPGAGRAAVVVGAGLGADTEMLARRGWSTTAFDVSPSSVRIVRDRHPTSTVDYREADLLDLADDLVGSFHLVVEVFTVQALPPSLREAAVDGVRRLLAPGGVAVIAEFVREPDEPVGPEPPWLLDHAEMTTFAAPGFTLLTLEAAPHPRRPDTGRALWIATVRRDGG